MRRGYPTPGVAEDPSMVSIVSLLSLQAYAVDVNAGGDIQQAVAAACTSGTPVTIELQTDDQVEWFIGPGGINGPLIEYPPAGCPATVPPITIRGSDGPAIIRYQPQAVATDANLMTFQNGARVTLENVILSGRTAAEVVDGVGSDFNELCALDGDRVRGVFHTAAQNAAGSLDVSDATFRCLDGAANPASRGAAIYSIGVPLVLDNSVFDSNNAAEGGAVAMIPGNANLGPTTNYSIEVSGSFFLRNRANFGAGIHSTVPNYAVLLTDSNFDLNVGEFGAGGALFDSPGDVTVIRTVFDRQNNDNFVENQEGGALLVRNSNSLTFRNNLVCGSWAGRGGGLYAEDPGVVDIEGSVFAENGALCNGGGIFIDEPFGTPLNDVRVVNNTFVGNEGGRPPPFINAPVCALGGGGAAAFWGVNPEFRNNVVAFSAFGGGVLGHYEEFRPAPAYQIGDEILMYNNIWYENVDTVTDGHVTGDFASVAFHPSNLVDVDPEIVYAGVGEFNCAPDAFYPQRTSPTVDAGGGPVTGGVPGDCVDMVDTDPTPDFEPDAPLISDVSCDIGAFGGEYGLFAKDTDGDGVQNIFDCNDNDSTVRPGQPESCDFIDNDCNGIVDDGLANTWYPDADGDGEGDAFAPQELSCAPIVGKVSNATDCEDNNPAINTAAAEVCDGADNNCSGVADDGLEVTQYYVDSDNDGYGDNSTLRESCSQPGPEFIAVSGDCDDGNAQVNPGQVERCDGGLDNDCNGLADAADPDSTGVDLYRVDGDGDGYGPIDTEQRRCSGEAGPEGLLLITAANAGDDCDDGDPAINPGALELCTQVGVDENCNGEVDELLGAADVAFVYADADGDGLGDNLLATPYCPGSPDIPLGVETAGDCDDSDPLVGLCPEPCGCQATLPPAQGALALLMGLAGILVRRRR